MVTRGELHVLWVIHTPIISVRELSIPKFWDPLPMSLSAFGVWSHKRAI